jgi:CBS domain containing-hemolysin-like protein
LEDVIEELIGQEIVDEFDSHDNLRAVALRNPKRNNITENHKDI